MNDPNSQRRQAAERYRAAKAALDEHIEQREAEKGAGLPVVTGDENDFEYTMLTEAYWQARREAPWWVPLRWR